MKHSKTILALAAFTILTSSIFGGNRLAISFDGQLDAITVTVPSSTYGSVWSDGSQIDSAAEIWGPGFYLVSTGTWKDFYNKPAGTYHLWAKGGTGGGYSEAWLIW